MKYFNLWVSLALMSTLTTAIASNQPTFDGDILNIPVVNTIKQAGKYEQVQFKLAQDGRWDLIVFSEPNQATVETINIQLLESFPIQVYVYVKGYLPNGCYGLGETHVTKENNQFSIVINMTELQTLVACTQALVPFEMTVPLDVYGLNAGHYLVNVNGISGSFELSADNFLGNIWLIGTAVYKRFNDWSQKQKLLGIFNVLIDEPDLEWEFVDGSIVKAHQHSSGAAYGLRCLCTRQKPVLNLSVIF